jgi:two-component system response regulator HydG
VADANYREDFFFRINVIQIQMPPLRDRRGDIPLLAAHFLSKYSHVTTKKVDHLTPDALELLKRYDWPGNVRELENAVERAVVLSKSRTLRAEDFSFLSPQPVQSNRTRTLREVGRDYIQEILEDQSWNITRSAEILGINRVTLHKMIKRYNLERPS